MASDALHVSVGLAARLAAPTAGNVAVGTPGGDAAPTTTLFQPKRRATASVIGPPVRRNLKLTKVDSLSVCGTHDGLCPAWAIVAPPARTSALSVDWREAVARVTRSGSRGP